MKLFQRLLIAPAALGLLAPVAANADVLKVEELNAGAFASATKMTGSSVFTTGFIDTATTANNKLTTEYNFKIDLNTSFTGMDNLYAGIEAGNQNDLVMDSQVNYGATVNTLNVASLFYSFPVGDFEVTAGPLLDQDDVISATTSIYSDAFRLASNRWTASGETGAGGAISYIGDNGWNGSISAVAVGANSSTVGAFTEEGQDIITASIGYDTANYGGGVVYKDDDGAENSIGGGIYFRPDNLPSISIQFDKYEETGQTDSSEVTIGLDYPVGPGTASAAFQTYDNRGTSTNNYEVYYNYPVNDGVTLQGGIFSQEVNGADNTQGLVVETFFSF